MSAGESPTSIDLAGEADFQLGNLRVRPSSQLAEARKTPAFKDFVRDLGFVEMWRKSGDWGDFCRPLGADDFECS